MSPLLMTGASTPGRGSNYLGSNVPIHLINVRCTRNEARLVDCPVIGGRTCSHREDASVACLQQTSKATIIC